MPSVKDMVKRYDESVTVNNTLTLNDIGNMKTASGKVFDAFLDPQLVTLRAGMRLYKFNSYSSLRGAKITGVVTPWWSPYEAYDVDPGWKAKMALAKLLGNCSLREFGRVTSAITESWNSCEYLVTITLRVDIRAMYGRFRQMKRSDGGSSQARVLTEGMPPGFRPEGKARYHKEFTDKDGVKRGGNLPGGGRQFFVPNLTTAHYTGFTTESLLTR